MKLKIFAAALMLTAAVASAAFAADIDYQEFQEDPLETAIRKLPRPRAARGTARSCSPAARPTSSRR